MKTKTRCRTMNCGKKKNLHKREKRPKKDEKNKKKRPIFPKIGGRTRMKNTTFVYYIDFQRQILPFNITDKGNYTT